MLNQEKSRPNPQETAASALKGAAGEFPLELRARPCTHATSSRVTVLYIFVGQACPGLLAPFPPRIPVARSPLRAGQHHKRSDSQTSRSLAQGHAGPRLCTGVGATTLVLPARGPT